jgi:PE family
MEVGMSSPWVIAAPEYVAAAASDLANIGSSLSTANMAALMPTSGVLAAGGDEVSAMIAALFSSHAQAYQALSEQAASFHAQFVQLMNTGASQYALAEAANASPLLETFGQGAAGAVNSAVQALTGGSGSPLVAGGGVAATFGSSAAKVTPAASVPVAGVTPLTGNGAAGASSFAPSASSGGGVSGGLLPSGAAALANPVANPIATPGVTGAGASGGVLSGDAAAAADGGAASAPVTSPLVPTAAPLPGSGGASETSGNGGVGRLGADTSSTGGQEGSGGEGRASGESDGGGGATGTIGPLRDSSGSFYASSGQGVQGSGTGTAAAAAISS